MKVDRISEILYRHDPANTGCNVNEGMEDEYDRIAFKIASIPNWPPSLDSVRQVLAAAFFEDGFSRESLELCHNEILRIDD